MAEPSAGDPGLESRVEVSSGWREDGETAARCWVFLCGGVKDGN